MDIKKLISNKIAKAWRFTSVYSAFSSRNKVTYGSPHFNRVKLTSREKKEYSDYWKNVSPIISFKTVEITKSLTGFFNKKIVPEEFLSLYIEPNLNSEKRITFLENKSIYNKWFGKGVFPKDFFHKINNRYYTYDFSVIENIVEFIDNKIKETDFPIVIKPNKDTYGGKDIHFVNNKEAIKEIIEQYPNLVVQEKLEQSELLNVLNRDSVNTIRVCLYRDNNNVMQLLNASVRMGVDGSLDNLTNGGIVCNIKPSGLLNKYANDKNARKYLEHPNSGFIFEDKTFPLYEDLVKVSKEVAANIIGARLISLDMSLDSKDKWRCIEVNLAGQTMLFAQYAGEPFFGKYTDEIINRL